ncbi:MAG: DUF2769 domain-containing protein [Nanoarchaeota archaeon]
MNQESGPKTVEEAILAMKNISPEGRDEIVNDVDKTCICAKCPSYAGTGDKMLTFCLKGKSKISKRKTDVSVLHARSRISCI